MVKICTSGYPSPAPCLSIKSPRRGLPLRPRPPLQYSIVTSVMQYKTFIHLNNKSLNLFSQRFSWNWWILPNNSHSFPKNIFIKENRFIISKLRTFNITPVNYNLLKIWQKIHIIYLPSAWWCIWSLVQGPNIKSVLGNKFFPWLWSLEMRLISIMIPFAFI